VYEGKGKKRVRIGQEFARNLVRSALYLYFFFRKSVVVVTQIVQIHAFWVIAGHSSNKIIAVFGSAERSAQGVLLQPEAVQRLYGCFCVLLMHKGDVRADRGVRRAMAVAIPMDDDLADLSVLSKVLWPTHRVLGGQCRGHADYVHQISLNDAVIVQVPAVQETRHHFRPRRQGRNFLFLLLLLLALPVLLYNSEIGKRVVGRDEEGT